MSADFSRVRFDPLRDHSGIGIQQGRLWLDADFNEQVAITNRRLRAQAVDLSPAPSLVSQQTPDAFRIELPSPGSMTIGAGRMYVDGLLAENHGKTLGFDAMLAEPNGTKEIDYLKQPYWPAPDALPTTGSHLIFLDVWERELTHLNTPDLVESAVGVDTTIRTQTAWQVRVLKNVGMGHTCGSNIPLWNDLIGPSTARLTTWTDKVDPVTEPCEIPPGKGYRGPENHLYRVELHSATQFKWSRDNATIASPAEVISPLSLRLQSLGRDEVLRINDNDWVEITDDRWELSHKPGEMRQVKVDQAASTISFTGGLGDLAVSPQNLRVRKWDSPLVTIPAAGTPASLEHGITVSFTGAGKSHVGDYWVFAARATAPDPEQSLEKLVDAPPRGIHHHYVRLALWTLPGKPQDCRPDWPDATADDCGCEVCVTPDGDLSIQDAVTKLAKSGGGTITLCPGEYALKSPIIIENAMSIRIRGAGKATKLVAPGAAVAVNMSQDITLQDFAIVGKGDVPGIVLFEGNMGTTLERLSIEQPQHTAIGLDGTQWWLTIRDCELKATTGIGSTGTKLVTQGLCIEGNRLASKTHGIDLAAGEGRSAEYGGLTRVTGNTVTGCTDAAITMTGSVSQVDEQVGGALEISGNLIAMSGWGIVTGPSVLVRDNTVVGTERMAEQGGIALRALSPESAKGLAHILSNKVYHFGGPAILVAARMRSLIVKQNIIRTCAGGILVQSTRSSDTIAIDNNQISDLRPIASGSGLHYVTYLAKQPPDSPAQAATEYSPPVARTHGAPPTAAYGTGAPTAYAAPAPMAYEEPVSAAYGTPTYGQDVPPEKADEPTVEMGRAPIPPLGDRAGRSLTDAGFVVAIGVMGTDSVAIAGNDIDGVAAEEGVEQTSAAVGILLSNFRQGRVRENTIVRVGYPQGMGHAEGMRISGWRENVSIVDNAVLTEDGGPVIRAGWAALTARGSVAAAGAAPTEDKGGPVQVHATVGGHAELIGNALHGGGYVPAATVLALGDVIMNGNRCAQPDEGDQIVVRVQAKTAIIHGNRLRGGHPDHPSMQLDVDPAKASVIGNISGGGISMRGTMADSTLNPIA